MGKGTRLGTVVMTHKGYNVRQIEAGGKHTGKYGLYAGKNLLANVVIGEAKKIIDREVEIATKKRADAAVKAERDRKEFERKFGQANRRTW